QPGYQPIDQTLAVGTSAVRKNFSAKVDPTACTALGYGHAALTHFDGWLGTTPKDGWTITNADPTTIGWTFDDGVTAGYNLAGTGNYALAAPYNQSGQPEDTTLVSPIADLRDDAAPVVSFGALYLPSEGSGFDADLSIDGGTTWNTIWHQTADALRGPVSVAVPQAAGQQSVRLRFRYHGEDESFAELDDITIGSCSAHDGGLVAGVVTDANTAQPLDDVTVADSASAVHSGLSTPGPDDPALPHGFYEFFDTTGAHRYTATASRYTSPMLATTVGPNSVTHLNVELQAGRLGLGSASLDVGRTLGQVATEPVNLTNTGTAPLHVSLNEHATGFRGVDATTAATGWQSMAGLPEFVRQNVIAGYQGKVYSVGGIWSAATGPIARGYVHDPVTAAWSPIAPLPQALSGAAGAFLDGTLYVAGGLSANGTVSTVYAYHPETDSWSRAADLPAPVYEATAATLGGKLYLVGGCTSKCGADPVKTVLSYDPGHNTWAAVADYPEAQGEGACAGVHDELVCAGGYGTIGSILHTTYAFHPANGTWTQLSDLPYDDTLMAYSGANGRLQIAGGLAQTGKAPATETAKAIEYDPVTDSWSALPDLPVASYGGGRGACALYQIGSQASDLLSTAALPGYDQCGDDDVAWLSESTTELDLAPGASAKVMVTFDSGKVSQPGTYTATVGFDTDTPYAVAALPVSLQASAPKAWGELSGTVTDTATGAGIADATVQVCTMVHNGVCGEVSYTLKTDAQGHYRLWLDKGYNPLVVTVAATGYQPQFRQVKVKAGAATVTDVALPKI
ncbi:Kelch repeat-containing protein, partial [Amycolatopsis sp. NPDC004368]